MYLYLLSYHQINVDSAVKQWDYLITQIKQL